MDFYLCLRKGGHKLRIKMVITGQVEMNAREHECIASESKNNNLLFQ